MATVAPSWRACHARLKHGCSQWCQDPPSPIEPASSHGKTTLRVRASWRRKGFAPRGAWRGVGMPSMKHGRTDEPEGEDDPQDEVRPQQPHLGHILRGSRRNPGRKSRGPARACWNAASRPPGRRARQRALRLPPLSGRLSTVARISSRFTCLWMTQSWRARARALEGHAGASGGGLRDLGPCPPFILSPKPCQSPNVRPW
jgi:hypothetical protein